MRSGSRLRKSANPFEARARVRRGFRLWMRTPPRRIGEIDYEREVSFLELFYDLVYVAVIGRAAHHLAAHLSWTALVDFAVVFGLIWWAWYNGSVWHELHGRNDGRSRRYFFAQMVLIALLAVFTNDAIGSDGPKFAAIYALLLLQYLWQWRVVQRADPHGYRRQARAYLGGMIVGLVAMIGSIFVGETARLILWASIVVGGVALAYLFFGSRPIEGYTQTLSSSLVERFGLFTILVLGEVVIGVVTGMSDAEPRTTITIAVGTFGMVMGMGIWWSYFDVLGRRVPYADGRRMATWLFIHLPITMSIAAAGAAMVDLVAHADADRTNATTAWILSGSLAITVVGIALAARALPADAFPEKFRNQLLPAYGSAGVVAVVLALFRPAPLVFAIGLCVVLFGAWMWGFTVFVATGGTFPSLEAVEAERVRAEQGGSTPANGDTPA